MVALPQPELPAELSALRALALDLRWTWNHESDALWSHVDAALWAGTRNPWVVLQSTPAERLRTLAADPGFLAELAALAAARQRYLDQPGWFREACDGTRLGGVAYLSMEFGLGAALPLYAGGLGVLAGDFLKAASDLDVPVIGVGLLYQEGYFRQMLEAGGTQQEFYPYNEPATMPIEPVVLPEGGWLRVSIELPGRELRLRVWRAIVGRVPLYLLDSNDPLNNPADRGITTKLYGGGAETRFLQEIALGIGGWRVVAALQPETEILHVNEGHAAFAVIERARQLALRENLDFMQALWATRAGNVFTTHTPVAAGFDRFDPALMRKYLPHFAGLLERTGARLSDIASLGRLTQSAGELFNMAYLALRGSAMTVGVSRLHGAFSRQVFQPLFPRWPTDEVPVSHITNGVHVPTWDSAEADRIWTESCGRERWRSPPAGGFEAIAEVTDERLWAMRGEGRAQLVEAARRRLSVQLGEAGFDDEAVAGADTVLDPNVLTLGFARRFTEYKRTNLLLRDRERLARLLLDERRPAQIVVAGKAHPADHAGKEMIRAWVELSRSPRFRGRIVFLQDYDIDMAQQLVQGVDVWINTPRRPWEACGTSGMKVLVNGGLNCSVRDGWWDEAYDPAVGWAIGVGGDVALTDAAVGGEEVAARDAAGDERDAASLYEILETAVVPAFYERDAAGLPRAWLARVRASMCTLTPAFSSSRMMKDYIERAYLPLARALRERAADGYAPAKALDAWSRALGRRWASLHIGEVGVAGGEAARAVTVPVYLGEVEPAAVRAELYAGPWGDLPPERLPLVRGDAIPGAANGFLYAAALPSGRPIEHYTVRVVPDHPAAILPVELPLVAWQR